MYIFWQPWLAKDAVLLEGGVEGSAHAKPVPEEERRFGRLL
jgi:hypothetical protein